MVAEPIPLSKLAKSLEECSGYDFQVLLRTLTSSKYVDDKLMKSDLAVFVAKILKLLRSSEDYQVWKGCHLVNVLCSYNPVALCSQAGDFLTLTFNKLEQKASYYRTTITSSHGRILLSSLVRSVGLLIDLVRDKPTLTREVLTPRLSVIISTLVNLSQFEPKLCLSLLKKLLLRNTTTFRPHANKFKTVLTNLLSKDYFHFDSATRKLIAQNYALLNLVKFSHIAKDDTKSHHNTYQDEQWRQGLMSVLFSFKPVINLCGEILDFSADSDMQKLLQGLPAPRSGLPEEIFPPLKVDLNEPSTLWAIVKRLTILSDLAIAFISQPTHFQLRIPLGGIIQISEAVLSLTANYLPLQRTLRRDIELASTIDALLPNLQVCGMRLLGAISDFYGKSTLPYTSNILSSLEMFIPLRKGTNSIDFDRVGSLEDGMFELIKVANSCARHLGMSLGETTLFIKLVEIVMHLVKDTLLLNQLLGEQTVDTQKHSNKARKANKQSKGSMSDIYSHPRKFTSVRTLKDFDALNDFLVSVVSYFKLPSVQQIKISKFCISTSLKLSKEKGQLPESFVRLLRALVLHPGYDRVSILPIAVTLLKQQGDDVFTIFCNPRLPFGSIQTIRGTLEPNSQAFSSTANEEDLNQISEISETLPKDDVLEQAIPGFQEGQMQNMKDHALSYHESTMNGNMKRLISEEPGKVFKKRIVETVKHNEVQENETLATEEKVETELTSIPVEFNDEEEKAVEVEDGQESGTESEFEIPEINVSDDDEC
ncbi:LAQU0S22e00694g1_1 [Lachancea quebecensis]|uniref:Pre-rRNA-processing protein RIX1 n=1 Tax=Lachancea quebecensis TaxID=1654605 RepID=A0A0P1L3J9_9SACH|nr:LAQU0S22e00694g1_1 [Lachancea quebecensis]